MNKISTGIDGLDKLLHGGLIPERVYVLSGPPGTGKTTVGLHFLDEGAKKGEKVLMISFLEPEEAIRSKMKRFGMEDSIEILDLTPSLELMKEGIYLFGEEPSSDGAQVTIRNSIVEKVESVKPKRIVIDGASTVKTLHKDLYTYRQQVLSMLRYLLSKSATVMLISATTETIDDSELRLIADGVISTKRYEESGEIKIGVVKYRHSNHMRGYHHMRIEDGKGVVVYPRVLPEEFSKSFKLEKLPSGIPELDEMMRGGVERGTVTIITGPSGVGKTTLATYFPRTAAERGENTAIYHFDEQSEIMLKRCRNIGIPLEELMKEGRILVREVEPLEYNSDEFIHMVLKDVEERDLKVVAIDTVNGYELSIRGEKFEENLRTLCRALSNMGVAVFLINEVEELERVVATQKNISYLADNIIILRYTPKESEKGREIRRRLAILKMRASDFDDEIVEFNITKEGFKIMRS